VKIVTLVAVKIAVAMINKNMKRLLVCIGLALSLVAVDAKPQKGPKGKGKDKKERVEGKIKAPKNPLKPGWSEKAERKSRRPKSGPDLSKWRGKRIESEELNEIRAKMRELNKELQELRKKHAVEMKKRMSEIKKEFANKRDEVIEGNKPGK